MCKLAEFVIFTFSQFVSCMFKIPFQEKIIKCELIYMTRVETLSCIWAFLKLYNYTTTLKSQNCLLLSCFTSHTIRSLLPKISFSFNLNFILLQNLIISLAYFVRMNRQLLVECLQDFLYWAMEFFSYVSFLLL